ncbi:hypothetical protein K438DRAFT_1867745 [Mycena galopus ATCC 62051]|nr:hypothetical protein K438DRAFT_1867745 [Mycena galopus ATCC 62051]
MSASVGYHDDSISTMIDAVKAALSKDPVLQRISATKKTLFARDLALIALGCRCAWLVDVAVVPDPEHIYAKLLRTLRQNHVFDQVYHLFEPASEQSFFVNLERCKALASSTDVVQFVLLRQDPQLVC